MDEYLRRGHRIVAVVSTDRRATDWANDKQIRVFTSEHDLLSSSDVEDFDFLFSIVHLRRLSGEILDRPQKCAINFHDGILPDYAGLNVTSWAILNGELEHGITWHLIESKLDVGDVVQARRFPIDDDESAFSLNAKCFEFGYISFCDLLDHLSTGLIQTKPQDLGRRNYYSKSKRPEAVGLIDWHRPAENIVRMTRALDFQRYDNPLCSAKTFLAGRPLIVKSAIIENHLGSARVEPGTIITIDDNGLLIATGTQAVRISELLDLFGDPVQWREVDRWRRQSAVTSPLRFDETDAEARASISEFDSQMNRHEDFWIRAFEGVEPLRLPWLAADQPTRSDGKTDWQNLDAGLPSWPAQLAASFADTQPGDVVLASLAAYLGQVSDQNKFALKLQAGHSRIPAMVDSLYASHVPLRVEIKLDDSFESFCFRFLTQLKQTRNCKTFALDLGARRPAIRDSITAWLESKHSLQVDRCPEFEEDIRDHAHLQIAIADNGKMKLGFDTHTWDQVSIQRFINGFDTFFSQLSDSKKPISSLDLVGSAEQRFLVEELNATQVLESGPQTIHEIFATQVEQTPSAIALVSQSRSVSYQELNERADEIAAGLAASGIGARSLVGVLMRRSVDLVASLLAILKRGAAYVPLDIDYPPERLAFMIEDSQVSLIIADGPPPNGISAFADRIRGVDEIIGRGDPSSSVTSFSLPGTRAMDLAYVIYTSGSTGRPKGVMVEHRNVVNFFVGMDKRIGDTEPGVWLAVTSISFDISVMELFWTLCRGFKVVLHDGELFGKRRPSSSDSPDRNSFSLQPSTISHDYTIRGDRPIEFGLYFFAKDEPSPDGGKYELLLESCKFADANGFSSVWTPERHFHDFGGAYPNASVISAAIAAITNHVRICAGSCVLPLHDPIRIAEEWGVVDNLSNGRVAISFATGWQPDDFVLAPERYEHRHAEFTAALDLVRKLWSGEAFEREGPVGPVVVTTLPRPIQPDLPVWITAAGNPETFRLAGTANANILTHLLGQSVEELATKIRTYRDARNEAGHAGPGHVTLMLHTFVSNDPASVRQHVTQPLTDYLRSATNLVKKQASSFPAFRHVDRKGIDNEFAKMSDNDMEALLSHAFERYFETSGLFGTPESCQDMVSRLNDAGVDEIGCLVDFGIPSEKVLKNLPALLELKDRMDANHSSSTCSTERRETGESFADLVRQHQVTHFQCTPSMARMLISDTDSRASLAKIGNWMIGGEPLTPDLWKDLQTVATGRVINMYGPTETTIWSTTREMDFSEHHVSIGRPIANTQVYVLDRQLRLLPYGAIGELFIGGHGVVRGYLKRTQLTREKFVPDPFKNDDRLYRTGDLVRWNRSRNLEFVGRLDSQLKIRGHRVELGEIESQILLHEAVKQAVVEPLESTSGAKRLVAYLVLKEGRGIELEELREFVGRFLPDFMLPAQIVNLESLPLTPNKKVDRNQLRLLEPIQLPKREAPKTADEVRLAEIFAEVLNIDQVGRFDSFLDLGGDSLSAVDVFVRIQRAFNVDLPLFEFFDAPTVSGVAAKLAARNSEASAAGPTHEELELLIDRSMHL